MACVGEAIGLSLPNSNMAPAPYGSRADIAIAAGKQIMTLLERNIRPRDICTREAFENAARIVAATGGSTNGALHLPAMANECGVKFDLFDMAEIFKTTPYIADLKPGDLIFWTGTYNDPNKKALKHDLVHVEIYTGTGPIGEGTLGSRYEGEGVEQPGVAEFESWRTFGGHGAHGHAVLFRSIDSWLEGVCINHCKSCSWGELNCKRGSSLFCPEASENSDPQ
jgi:hypothetical protein